MKDRWLVVALGVGWEHRQVVRGFATKIGATRYAEQMDKIPGIVPLKFVAEPVKP